MQQDPKTEPENVPFGSWKVMYWLVLGALALQIVVYYLITRSYA